MGCIKVVWRVGAVALVAFAVAAFAALAIGPRTGRYRTLTVLSASMRPTMPEGSVVVVAPVPAGELRVGDAITYRIPVEDRRVVTHRITEIVEAGERPVVQTKGDAVDTADPWVARLDGGPAWRVVASVPYAGYAINALGAPAVRTVTVLALPLLLAAWVLVDIWARRPEEDADEAATGQGAGTLEAGAAHPQPAAPPRRRTAARPVALLLLAGWALTRTAKAAR